MLSSSHASSKSPRGQILMRVVPLHLPPPPQDRRHSSTSGTKISPTGNQPLKLNKVAPEAGGEYHLRVTNAGGTAVSDEVDVIVYYPPTLTGTPVSTTVADGGSHTFTAAATGFDSNGTNKFTWKWYKNGKTISGATTGSLKLSKLSTEANGKYHAVVSNKVGSASTRAVTLEVIEAPSFSSNPSALRATPARRPTFPVRRPATISPTNGIWWTRKGRPSSRWRY